MGTLQAVVTAAWLAVTATAAVAGPSRVFELPGDRTRAVVLTRSDAAIAEVPATAMQQQLSGITAVLTPPECKELLALEEAWRIEPGVPEPGVVLATVHLLGQRSSARIRLVLDAAGACVAVRLDDAGSPVATSSLKPGARAWLTPRTSAYTGPWSPIEEITPRGRSVTLPQPYTPSPITLDDRGLAQRFFAGRGSTQGHTRQLERELLSVRVPKGYDPRTPAGLVVWLDPTDDGRIPDVFSVALDAKNLIAIGVANAGNGRHWPDRVQLALDAVATAKATFHIDPTRVYAAGLSGGGRIASMLVVCCPDVFAGGAAIAGLNSYKSARTQSDGKTWPASMAKPTGQIWTLLRSRRLAAVTGPADFNFEQMRRYADGLLADGLAIGWFEYADMGHELPTPARIDEVLRWLDEPQALARAQAIRRAEELAARVETGDGLSPIEARALQEAIALAPWSEHAWRAVHLLAKD